MTAKGGNNSQNENRFGNGNTFNECILSATDRWSAVYNPGPEVPVKCKKNFLESSVIWC